jgi:restriction system protein
MARRYSIVGAMASSAREMERAQRARIRAAEQAQRALARQKAQLDKEAKQVYLDSRLEETQEKNEQIKEQIANFKQILEKSLQKSSAISFNSLRNLTPFHEFVIPPELQKVAKGPQLQTYLDKVKKPGILEKLIPGSEKRYEKAIQEANESYQAINKKYETYLFEREAKITDAKDNYLNEKQAYELKAQQQNSAIDEFEVAYLSGDPNALCSYFNLVLEKSEYPDDFPQEFRVAYVPEPKELVIEYELPSKDIIPQVAEFRYVKTKDVIDEKLRKPTEIKELYQDVVASVCLRTIHELIEADHGNHILIITMNAFVDAVDPSTGKDIRPCLLSVRATKERFIEINLDRIEKRACLRNLGAQVSPNPDELLAVKPIVEFDMVDKRFVEQSDVLSELESRPNLMDLNPFEFENLVSNLFEKMGFQSKQTRSSRDGGVDAIAYDARPILGGKVVIQAKRYKNVVGVSAVRDLYGTMINEGANKGILVCTSHYGPDAYDFAKDKPIEFIDGGGLLYLLEQQGIKARIIFPED